MNKPAVIVISSHVARGTVGNRAAVFALETLGFPVWAVPTVVLPWHPGHGLATRIVPDAKQFRDFLEDLSDASWLDEVGGVLSGYVGEPAQAEAIAALVLAVKARKPDALYVCDPVTGDSGGLYVPQATAEAMRDRLLPLADVATPNAFELGWMTGRDVTDLDDALEAARAADPATMLVTSLPGLAPDRTGSLLVTAGEALLAGHGRVERPPNGLGDLTAALLLARFLSGASNEEALRSTTASVLDVLVAATGRGADELMLETDAGYLSQPASTVEIRRLALAGRSA